MLRLQALFSCGFDLRPDRVAQRTVVDRSDEFEGDGAVTLDDIGLGHAVDAEVDASAPARINADRGIRIALLAEITARIFGQILVGDADEFNASRGEAFILRERDELRIFLMARAAP